MTIKHLQENTRLTVSFALCLVGFLVCFSVVSSQSIPNHLSVVTAARSKYSSFTKEKRAFCIVSQVAFDLKAEGAGTFFKNSGTSYNERSIDVIIYKPNKETFDILGDAEGSATPQWRRTEPTGFGDIKLWREPQNPDSLGCKIETPLPEPISDDRKKLKEIRDNLNEYLGDQ